MPEVTRRIDHSCQTTSFIFGILISKARFKLLGSISSRTLMVLLLISMQRMENVDWGLHPLFVRATGSSPQIHVNDKELGSVDLKLEAEDRMTHYGLRGHATNVFPVKSDRLSEILQKFPSQNKVSGEMVAKIFWPEESRESEPDIIKKVQKIGEANPNDVKGHILEMVWFHKFDDTSTATVRKALLVSH
jgi:hypothetical protein